MNSYPIGVFDSGIGGLTVVKEIIKILPNESLIYLGDTARVPYGTRNKDTINKFAIELVMFLLKQKVKALVVACNTMSAVSLTQIKKRAGNVPVIDVIGPTVAFSVSQSKTNKIGVIGTRATINSRAYEKQMSKINKKIKVISKACPLFVPLVEEGLINGKATELIARSYLSVFDETGIDSLILGCTHYPLLKKIIAESLKDNIIIIDSARPTAEELKRMLMKRNLPTNKKSENRFYVTDIHPKMAEMINLTFDGKFPGKLEKIQLQN